MKVQAMANKGTFQKEVQNALESMQKIKTPSCYLTFDIHCLQATFSEALRRKKRYFS